MASEARRLLKRIATLEALGKRVHRLLAKSVHKDIRLAAGSDVTVVTGSYVHQIEGHFYDTDTPNELGHVIYTGFRPGSATDLNPTTASTALWSATPVNPDDPYIQITTGGNIVIKNSRSGAQAIRVLISIYYSMMA